MASEVLRGITGTHFLSEEATLLEEESGFIVSALDGS